MKRHTAFVARFLKDCGHPELVDIWNSKSVREQWLKLKFQNPNKPKRQLSSFLLFCAETRPKIKEEHPYDTPARIMQRLGICWQWHKKANDETFQKFTEMYARNVFFSAKRSVLIEKYPTLTQPEIEILIEKIWKKKRDLQIESQTV